MTYFNWAIIGTTVTMVWGYLSGFISRLRSLVIINVRLSGGAKDAFMLMLWQEFKRSKLGDKHFSGCIQHIAPLNQSQVIGYEDLPTQPLIFWKRWKPIVIGGMSYSPSTNDMMAGVANITFVRGMFDIDELLIRAFDIMNERHAPKKENHRFFIQKIYGSIGARNNINDAQSKLSGEAATIPNNSNSTKTILEMQAFRILKWKHDDLGLPRTSNPLEGYAYPESIKGLLNEINRWSKSKEWFMEKRIPWKIGILMHSKPGCGKSSLCRAIGQKFDLPIFVYDLAAISNKEFDTRWEMMKANAPCIALMEDIDTVFHGRENIKNKEEGLTFDCLLNSISGVDLSDGIVTIITTNDITKIDPALGVLDEEGKSSRPGRINYIVELGEMTLECRQELADKILIDCPSEIQNAVKRSDGYTPAQVQELFSSIALDHFWRKNHEFRFFKNNIR